MFNFDENVEKEKNEYLIVKKKCWKVKEKKNVEKIIREKCEHNFKKTYEKSLKKKGVFSFIYT